MKLENAVVLITGANRGLGLAFAREALARGARKVYAAARDPSSVKLDGVVPVRLDVNKPEDVAALARDLRDVQVLINNAGIAITGGFLNADSASQAQAMLDTNFFGPMRLTQAFAPILAANGGGAVLNVLSVASWINGPLLGAYGASKSAAWALTNGLRIELQGQGTQVLGLHAGFIDTDLTQGLEVPKSTPQAIVMAAFDGLESGAREVLADDISRMVHQGLTAEPAVYLQAIER
ncbi:MAG TPA: SDR family oxidoreductase [Roseateles sp.]|nr:SDR family oxidoreductase [Roseateles sp.]